MLSFGLGILVAWLGSSPGLDYWGPLLLLALPAATLLGVWALYRPIVAAVLVPLTLPIGFVVLPGGLLQVADAVMVAVIGLVTFHRLSGGLSPLPNLPGRAFLFIFCAIVILATTDASDVNLAVRQAVAVVVGALFVLAMYRACSTLKNIRLLVGLMLLAGLVICVPALGQISSVKGTAGGEIVSGTTGIFSEHNQLGGFAAALLMLSLGALLGARARWSRVGALIVAGLALVTVALALSRGGYLATVLGMVVLVSMLPKVRRGFLIALLLLAGGAAILWMISSTSAIIALVMERIASFSAPSKNPYDARPQIWAEAFRQMNLDPLTGSGPGNYPVVALEAESPARYAMPDHAHDVLLTAAAEVGIPAAATMALLTVLWARLLFGAAHKLQDSDDGPIVAGLSAALATFVGQGIFDMTLRSPVMLLLLCTCLGLSLAAARSTIPIETRL